MVAHRRHLECLFQPQSVIYLVSAFWCNRSETDQLSTGQHHHRTEEFSYRHIDHARSPLVLGSEFCLRNPLFQLFLEIV